MINQAIKRELKDYVNITLGLMLYTFGFTVFLLPYEIVTGGIAGIGAVVFYATKFPVQYTFFIINAVLIVAALKILGWRFLMKTIYATFALTFLLEVAQDIVIQPDGTFYKLMGEGNDFMSLVIGCTLTGTSLAVVFLNNGSTGGTDIIALIVGKFRNISPGRLILAMDVVIILSSMLFPSYTASGELVPFPEKLATAVYGLILITVSGYSVDLYLSGSKQSVQVIIFSSRYKEIADAIVEDMKRGVTIIHAEGWYTKKESQVILVMTRKTDLNLLLRYVKTIDPDAFLSVSTVMGVFGKGFDTIKVKPAKGGRKTDLMK